MGVGDPPWVLGVPRGGGPCPVSGQKSQTRAAAVGAGAHLDKVGVPGQGRPGAAGVGGSLVGQSPGERGSVIRTRCSGGSPRYGRESHFWGGPSFLIPQRGPGGTGGGLGTARVPPIGPGARQPLRERGSPLGPPPSSARSRRGPTPGTCWAVVPAAPAKPQQKPFSAGALPVPPHRCHSPCPPLSPRSSGTPRAPSPIAPGWEFPSAPRESSAAGAGLRLSRSRARVFFGIPFPRLSRLRGGPGEPPRDPFCPSGPRQQLPGAGMCRSAFQGCISAPPCRQELLSILCWRERSRWGWGGVGCGTPSPPSGTRGEPPKTQSLPVPVAPEQLPGDSGRGSLLAPAWIGSSLPWGDFGGAAMGTRHPHTCATCPGVSQRDPGGAGERLRSQNPPGNPRPLPGSRRCPCPYRGWGGDSAGFSQPTGVSPFWGVGPVQGGPRSLPGVAPWARCRMKAPVPSAHRCRVGTGKGRFLPPSRPM